MAFLFVEPKEETFVYVKVMGKLQKFRVETNDVQKARHAVIDHLDEQHIPSGAVLALVN